MRDSLREEKSMERENLLMLKDTYILVNFTKMKRMGREYMIFDQKSMKASSKAISSMVMVFIHMRTATDMKAISFKIKSMVMGSFT